MAAETHPGSNKRGSYGPFRTLLATQSWRIAQFGLNILLVETATERSSLRNSPRRDACDVGAERQHLWPTRADLPFNPTVTAARFRFMLFSGRCCRETHAPCGFRSVPSRSTLTISSTN